MKKRIVAMCAVLALTVALSVSAFAAEPTTIDLSEITTSMVGSFGQIATNISSLFTVVLPIGLSIMAMYILVGLGKKLFKKLTA